MRAARRWFGVLFVAALVGAVVLRADAAASLARSFLTILRGPIDIVRGGR